MDKGCQTNCDHDRISPDFDLLSPIKIRGTTLRNRIVVSPMCQYSSNDGFADDWHIVHLGSRAVGGAGLIFTEATAVTKQGRISPADLGIWDDKHIDPLKRITNFIKRMGGAAGIQLAHAGRKGSCAPPWLGRKGILSTEGGWEIVAPSEIPFSATSPAPIALDKQGIEQIIQAFLDAVKRSLEAGFDIVELHSAHGYLLNQFLSPLTNKRTDEFGGSFENRMRLLSRIVEGVRKIIPEAMPLFVRISATDWVDDGWKLEDSLMLAKKLIHLGVDLIDVSSGGVVSHAAIPVAPNYQVPFAAAIRKQVGMLTGAVGLITDPHQANDIITSGNADLVFIAREFLREPYWALEAEQALNQTPTWPMPYSHAMKRHK